MRGWKTASLALAGGVAAGLIAGQTAHAGPFNLGDELFGHKPAKPPPLALYRDNADGDPAFILDRSSSVVLLRFQDSPEIWLLTPHPAPRGDIIYKNDVGEAMLRATRLGGLTLFTSDRPDGMPAAMISDAPPLRLPPVPNASVFLFRMAQASAHASHAVQRLILFEARDPTPESAPLIADAANVTAEAVVVMAKRADGKRILLRLAKVILTPGRRASVALANGVLEIVVVDKANTLIAAIAGRPSSRKIELALAQ
ncbi:MAG TPA: DUF4908 domain-containing protein [Caulobacteraceae bacterium]|nr:DUF4908 domain-containing protein [Caulobacteraceae bacterium]